MYDGEDTQVAPVVPEPTHTSETPVTPAEETVAPEAPAQA